MEEEKKKKRWSVTYTKHIKQKRKVYHDGFLDLHISTNKLMLYDESEKLLECRMLARDEVVGSSQTLTFDAYLVDVGLLQGPSRFDSSHSTRNRNEVKPIGLRLSPSQKIIREFKKSELQKYGPPQTCLTTTAKSSVKEWQVMYTTQVTQKAKKYHDGFLQLTNSGTLQRQIMLYDGSKKLINSRFLKKDEVIQSGESIAFDGHLVDIGEPEESNQGLMDSDVCLSNYNVAGKTGVIHQVRNCLKTNKSFLKGKPQKIASSKENADPSFTISSVDETKLSQNITANKPLRDATQIMSILQKPMMQVIVATQSIDKCIMHPVPSVKDPQNSDSSGNILESIQLPTISIKIEGLDSVAKPSGSGDKSSKKTEVENSHQLHSQNMEACTKWCNEAAALSSSTEIAHTCHDIVDLTKDSAELKISREAGRCPSFDLGFD
ncbi:hypothetical protein PTKIN_Ptkin09bG0088400 [Pterospermum kingtungense]